MLLFCVCVRVFLAQKKTPKYESQRTKQTLLLASTLTKQSAVVHTTRLVRKRDHLHSPTSIHPSDDDALLLLPDRNADHHRRCKTLERERERDNLLIVQRRRERKNFEEKKKGGNFVLRTIKMHSRHRVVQTRDDFDNAATREQQGFRGATTDPSSFRSFAEQMTTTTTTTRGLTTKQKLLGPTLLLVGTISLTVFFLVQFGAIELHEKDETRGTKAATFVIGVLSFLPGAYATTVLVQVRRGAEGWSYEMLRDT